MIYPLEVERVGLSGIRITIIHTIALFVPELPSDYASTQVGLGILLDDNEFRTPPATYAEIDGEVHAMLRCGWARPRQVERAVGRLTSRMLLLRLTLCRSSTLCMLSLERLATGTLACGQQLLQSSSTLAHCCL